MKTIKLLYLIVATFLFTITSSAQSFIEFKSVLDDCRMKVDIPAGFIESKVIENDDMSYDYAIKYQNKDFELRYSIRPIKYKHYSNDTIKNEIEGQIEFRNSSYRTILETIILNITGGIDYKIQEFDRNSVKDEFNADWGATSLVELKSSFGKGFKYCMVVAIHKKDIADAYYFYLSNTKENFSQNMDPLFHTLTFDK